MAMKKYRIFHADRSDSLVDAERLTYDGTGALIFAISNDIVLMIAEGQWKAVRLEDGMAWIGGLNGSKTPSE